MALTDSEGPGATWVAGARRVLHVCDDWRLEHLGTIDADTEKEAIERAAKLFNIEPARRFMLAVTKISEK